MVLGGASMPKATIYDVDGNRLGEASVVLSYEHDRTWGSMSFREDLFELRHMKVLIEIPSADPSGHGPGFEWVDEAKEFERNDLVEFSIRGGVPGHFLLEGPGLNAARRK